jgi:RNA polymerase sigma-70 factor (ECF subfamily)
MRGNLGDSRSRRLFRVEETRATIVEMRRDNAERFSTTHWSLVVQAGDKRHPAASQALAALCARYWFPLYAFVRREGHGEHDAQDLTQAFFARLLEEDDLRDLDPARGRFRSFLLASLRHFLSNARDRRRTLKRGGGHTILSLDLSVAERRYANEPADRSTPEALFHRRWALETLQAVLERLRLEWGEPARREFFAAVEEGIVGEMARPYSEIAEQLGMTEGAVKTAMHRLRRRYREFLREQIAETVSDPSLVDDEIRDLLGALRGP